MRHFLSLAFFLVLSSPLSIFAAEISPLLKEAQAAAAPHQEIPIIVTFAAEADLRPFKTAVKTLRRAGVLKALRATAAESQREVRALLEGRGKKFEPLWIVNGMALDAPPELISILAARPEVSGIELDTVIEVPEVIPSQAVAAEWNLRAVGAPTLWERGITGEGVTVAILDSGVDLNHPDLGPRWRGGANSWFDPYRSTATPYDIDGHGTLVAGIIVGGSAGGTAIGVAPGARWIAAKIFSDPVDDSGSDPGTAQNSRIILSLQWLLDPDGDLSGADAPDLVNASWGFDVADACVAGTSESGTGSVRRGIQALKEAGIGFVAAAGNTGSTMGTPSSVSPGNYPEAVAVGAVDRSSILAPFSARGPSRCDGSTFPDLVAPGVGIRTSERTPDLGAGAPFASVDGTSFSAPHVSGVMALLLSGFPSLTITEVEQTLERSASDLGSIGQDNSYGFGLLNAERALNFLSGVPDLAIHDPAPPENDLILDFGHVPPGTAADRTITLRNAGNGILNIVGIGTLPAPFTLVAEGCTNRNLTGDQTCTISLRFAPPVLGPFPPADLEIRSSDPDRPVVKLHLAGTGNTLPPAAQLLSPADGAVGVETPAVLQWNQLPDADGDTIAHFVLLSTREDFDTFPQRVPAGTRNATALAGGLFLALAAGIRRRRQWLSTAILLAAALAIIASCGGGGSSDSRPAAGEQFSFPANGLAPATRYFWKVVSEDSRGGAVEGAVRQFTTR